MTTYISDEEIERNCVSAVGGCEYLMNKTSRKGRPYLYCRKYQKPAYLSLHLCIFDKQHDPQLRLPIKHADMLDTIFIHQKNLQIQLDTFPEYMDQQYIKDMVLAAQVELTEVLNETSWKPWKKQQETHPLKYKQELADLLHFFVNLCLAAEMTPKELFNLYMDKNKENIDRKESGY